MLNVVKAHYIEGEPDFPFPTEEVSVYACTTGEIFAQYDDLDVDTSYSFYLVTDEDHVINLMSGCETTKDVWSDGGVYRLVEGVVVTLIVGYDEDEDEDEDDDEE